MSDSRHEGGDRETDTSYKCAVTRQRTGNWIVLISCLTLSLESQLPEELNTLRLWQLWVSPEGLRLGAVLGPRPRLVGSGAAGEGAVGGVVTSHVTWAVTAGGGALELLGPPGVRPPRHSESKKLQVRLAFVSFFRCDSISTVPHYFAKSPSILWNRQ